MSVQSISVLEPILDKPIGTGLLAFRDLNEIIQRHVSGNKALDFGCGAGRSTRYLQELGLDVIGVDISEKMLVEARKKDLKNTYYFIREIDDIPTVSKFDLILISFVFMEYSKKEDIASSLKKLAQRLSEKGKIIFIVCTEQFYNHNWLSINADFPENKSARSGQIVRVYLRDYNMEVYDHLWTKIDYLDCCKAANLSVIAEYLPLGKKNDNRAWDMEFTVAPFAIYVCGL